MVSGACRRMYCGTRDEARCALAQNQSHEANHPLSHHHLSHHHLSHHHLSHHHLSHHHLRRSNVNMDDIRGSLSKMKKKIKHRLTGRKRKPDGTNPGGEGADSTSSLPQSEHHILAGEQPDSTVPGRGPEVSHPDKGAEPSTAANENEKKTSWKSTASSTAKLLLRGVRDSADAFGPLKSVAGGLCFILENCEV